jgi:hypothetical protein
VAELKASFFRGMLGLQNILQKKNSYKVMWHNMIEKEMNPSFKKFNHVVPHHFVRVFFFV